MAAVYLARHGSHTLVDSVLLGRSDPLGLSDKGRAEARAAAVLLRDVPIALVQSSPRRRCRETAMLIATELSVPLFLEAALDEVDFGGWTGKRFDELEHDEHWRRWNNARADTRPPGGESAKEAQKRILAHLAQAERRPLSGLLMVTHAELIRCALLARQGLSLNEWHCVNVAPGSVVRADTIKPQAVAS
jgi:broad specificity phosphatase PhoE